MPYIARDDGERFVIPSYRDVLSAKKSNLLKKEILSLSESYGSYAVLIKKNLQQYEIALSPDLGYLLGETVWHHFKRPLDLIYCEVIPNTTEAILVIVKSGSVFIDGSFPIDSISDELVVFQTQHANFEIYIHGEVPISQTPEEGKFSFDSSQVKSFTVLDEPVFEKLPTLRSFQLQPIEAVLRAQGIGVIPIKGILVFLIFIGLIWMGWTYLTSPKKEIPQTVVSAVPYQDYINALTSPDPYAEIKTLEAQITRLFSMPGWIPVTLEYNNGRSELLVRSLGAETSVLLAWAKENKFEVKVRPDGFHLFQINTFSNRSPSDKINKIDEIVATIVDRIATVLPGNNLVVGQFIDKGEYKEGLLGINLNKVTVDTLDLVGQQLNNLPLVLTKVSFNFSNGYLTGTITLSALGN